MGSVTTTSVNIPLCEPQAKSMCISVKSKTVVVDSCKSPSLRIVQRPHRSTPLMYRGVTLHVNSRCLNRRTLKLNNITSNFYMCNIV